MGTVGNGNVPLLSFFTGAGFLDIGFIDSGFNPVWFNEVNSEFARGFTYGMATLYGKQPAQPRIVSIEELAVSEILLEAFGLRTPPDVFGVIGGPPCPDFSVAGTNSGFNGKNGRLTEVFVERIISLKPTFFVFENVLGILRTKKHREHFKMLRKRLDDFFQTDLLILNALEYGVPQDRQRVFLVGFLKSWLERNRPWMRNGTSVATDGGHWFPLPPPQFRDAKGRYDWPGVEQLGVEPEPPPQDIPTELMVGPHLDPESLRGKKNTEDFFKPRSPKISKIPEGDVSRKSFKRLHRYRFSPTAAYGNNEVHLHPYCDRRLTVREAMRIQSVPDEYVLPSDLTLTNMFKMISNGVPVKLAKAVATGVKRVLDGEEASTLQIESLADHQDVVTATILNGRAYRQTPAT